MIEDEYIYVRNNFDMVREVSPFLATMVMNELKEREVENDKKEKEEVVEVFAIVVAMIFLRGIYMKWKIT